MVKLILNAFNIFLTSNPSWFLFILKTNQTWALYKLKLIGFEFKINTNLQLGLRLKKLFKLGQNQPTKIKPNLLQKAWFNSIFIAYKLIILVQFIFYSKTD